MIEFALNGTPIDAQNWHVDHSLAAASVAAFDTTTLLGIGDAIEITADGSLIMKGLVTTTMVNSRGTISAVVADHGFLTTPAPTTEFKYGDVVRWKNYRHDNERERYMIIRRVNDDGWYNMMPVDASGEKPVTFWGPHFEVVE